MNFIVTKEIEGAQIDSIMSNNESPPENESNTSVEDKFGCFKSCLLNLHIFTLSSWLTKKSNTRYVNR